MTVTLEKRELREQARQWRAEFAAALPDFATRVATFSSLLGAGKGDRISGYRALPDEADPSLLLAALEAQGCEVSYPRVHAKAQPLWFHVPVAHEPWQAGAFGIPEPRADWPRTFPSLLLVPLLAFDAEGDRLGYGGGYYDRTLARFRAERTVTAIGLAFARQEIEHVPHETGDERLDMVVTENGIRRFRER